MPKNTYHSAPPGEPTQKEKLKEITDKLEAGVREMFPSEKYAKWLKTMLTFHQYSFNNSILIAVQAPEATRVASYDTWKKLKRQVRKGEKGIKILVPAPVKVKKEIEQLDPLTAKPLLDQNGVPVKGIEEHLIQHFKIGHVFSYEQTDGEPLPSLGPDELTGSADNYENLKEAITDISPTPIRYELIQGGAKGYYSPLDKEIVINIGMSELQTIKTMIHETAHALCHDLDIMKAEGIQKDRQTKEVEAESVAYTVCQFFGLDTSDYSFAYVTGWSSSREIKELRESMEFIRKTSGDIIDQLQEKLVEKDLPEERSSILEDLRSLKEKSALVEADRSSASSNSLRNQPMHSGEVLR